VSHYLISGDAYVLKLPLKSKKPTELWVLRPDRVRINHDAYGRVTGYEYRAGGGSVTYPVDPITGACDVMHIKKFHPLDDHKGLSPMACAAKSIDIVNEALNWNKSLLQNGARPSGAFVVKEAANNTGRLSDEQYTRMREQLANEMTGSANAGEPLLLEGGVDWKEMSMSPRDMDFENNFWASARMIATAYGVPPQLVNIKGESTYSNYAEAKVAFWMDTVIPLIKMVFSHFDNWLTPLYGEGMFIELNEDSIDAMEDKRWMKYDRLEKVSFLTANEKRTAVGLAPVDGGDALLVDSGKVPIDILSDGILNEPTA
jgi:HK97 family phage portal protein